MPTKPMLGAVPMCVLTVVAMLLWLGQTKLKKIKIISEQ